jgi:hypothetical protein
MERLADLRRRTVDPEPTASPAPVIQPFNSMALAEGPPWVPATFETAAFNFLLEHRQALGVATIWRCKNVRIDGMIELDDGSRLGIEVKYAMNWEKACQACAQIALYQERFPGDLQLDGGLVVFDHFTNDWARKKRKDSPIESGWSHWYSEHQEVGKLRVDLARLRDGRIESYSEALVPSSSTA